MQRLVAIIMCGVPEAAAAEIAVDAGTRPPREQQLLVTAEYSHCWHGPHIAGMVLTLLAWTSHCWHGPHIAGMVLTLLACSTGCNYTSFT